MLPSSAGRADDVEAHTLCEMEGRIVISRFLFGNRLVMVARGVNGSYVAGQDLSVSKLGSGCSLAVGGPIPDPHMPYRRSPALKCVRGGGHLRVRTHSLR